MQLTFRKALLSLLVGAFFITCSPAKKIEKAKLIVLTNKQASADVFNELSRLWPCVNDTTFISEGRDSVVTYDTIYASDGKGGGVMELNQLGNVHVDGMGTSPQIRVYDDVPIRGRFEPTQITKTIRIHDTIKSVVVDNRALNMQKDSTGKYMQLYYEEKDKVTSLEAEHHDLSRMFGYTIKALLAKWWFWSILVGGGALFLFKGKLGIVGTVISKILNKFK